MKKLINLYLFLILLSIPLLAEKTFKIVDKWDHGEQILGRHWVSMMDKDGDIVGGFYMSGVRFITHQKVMVFAKRGQAPNDLMGYRALFDYKGDLAVVEMEGKIKVFTKTDGIYKWKETIWQKRGKYVQRIKDAVFIDNKFFMAGHNFQNMKKDNSSDYALVTVYDLKGNQIKHLIKGTEKGITREMEKNYHVIGSGEKVYFLAEDEPAVHIISTKTLEVEKKVQLETPGFYKKIPGDFYAFKRYQRMNDLMKDIEKWISNYSRISFAGIAGNHLVLQVRTCSGDLKTFALLFYNLDTFKLEHTVFSDDFLLGVRHGKFYCYANGNPSIEDDTDNCIIHIYKWLESK